MKATRWLLLALRLFALGACATSDSGCDSDEVPFEGFCYYFDTENQKLDWQKAEDYCLTRKSHLISIHSLEEWEFLIARQQSGWTWLGLKKFDENDTSFTDGTDDDNPWFSFNSESMRVSTCMKFDNAKIVSYSFCTEQMSFVCKKARGVADDRLQQPVWSDKCGRWKRNPSNDLCYWFNNNYRTTWPMAQMTCQCMGAQLLDIADFNEQTFLHDSLQVFWKETSLWIGAYNSRNSWRWLTGSWLPFIRWSTGTYNPIPGDRCLYLNANDAHWGEDSCMGKRGFICKKKKAEKH